MFERAQEDRTCFPQVDRRRSCCSYLRLIRPTGNHYRKIRLILIMVDVITYMAARLLEVVALRVAKKRRLTAVIRIATTFAKLLFVVLSRTFRKSLYAMLVLTRGSRWQSHYP